MTEMPAYVDYVDDKFVYIDNYNKHIDKIKLLGFIIFSDGSMRCETHGKAEIAKLFSQLRDIGFAFSYGRDWCPIAVFEHLRDEGLLSGECLEISWRGPNAWIVRPNPFRIE